MVGFGAGGAGGDELGQPILGSGASVVMGLQGKQKRVGRLLPASGMHGAQAPAGLSVTGHLNGGILVPGPACELGCDELFDPTAKLSPAADEFMP